jgi:hypothetical protein
MITWLGAWPNLERSLELIAFGWSSRRTSFGRCYFERRCSFMPNYFPFSKQARLSMGRLSARESSEKVQSSSFRQRGWCVLFAP